MTPSATIAQQIVNDLSGEFASYTAEQITPYVDEARLSLDECFWDTKYDLASKYLAMHIITSLRNGGAGAAGPVASKSAGELSISYATPSSDAYTGLYSTTGWGRRYAELLRTIRYKATSVV